MKRSFADNFDRLIEVEKLDRTEGPKGVENLAKLVHFMGYSDFQHYGQLRGGACLGDILEFLEDNPGAIEALQNWIREQGSDDDSWDEEIAAHLGEADALKAVDTLTEEACIKLLKGASEDDESLEDVSLEDMRALVRDYFEDGNINAEDILAETQGQETDV